MKQAVYIKTDNLESPIVLEEYPLILLNIKYGCLWNSFKYVVDSYQLLTHIYLNQ